MFKQSKTDKPNLGPRRLLSVNDAAHYLGMSRSWLYIQIKFGHIKVKKFGSATRIEISELDNFADELAT